MTINSPILNIYLDVIHSSIQTSGMHLIEESHLLNSRCPSTLLLASFSCIQISMGIN